MKLEKDSGYICEHNRRILDLVEESGYAIEELSGYGTFSPTFYIRFSKLPDPGLMKSTDDVIIDTETQELFCKTCYNHIKFVTEYL